MFYGPRHGTHILLAVLFSRNAGKKGASFSVGKAGASHFTPRTPGNYREGDCAPVPGVVPEAVPGVLRLLLGNFSDMVWIRTDPLPGGLLPQIRHAIFIAAPAERVYGLVSTPSGFSQWWSEDVTENNAAHTVDLGFFNRATVYRLAAVRMAPPQSAEWVCQSGQEWQDTHLVFDTASKDGGTMLRFAHADWKAETDYFISCNTTWGELMFRLKACAEGKEPGPLFTRNAMAY